MTVQEYLTQAKESLQSGETEQNLSDAKENYEKALEMENDNPEAYLGIADVYIRENDYDGAKEVLEDGMETTGDISISQKIREMESGSIFDSDGKIRIRRGYDEEGNLKWYHKVFYREDKKEKGTGLYTPDGEEMAYVKAVYNAEGQFIEGAGYSGEDGSLDIGKMTYDENGNCVTVSQYTLDGEWKQTTSYVYDEEGHMIEEHYEDPSGGKSMAKYDLDENGNQVKISFYNENGLMNYNTMEYDKNDNCIRENFYSKDGNLDGYSILKYNDDHVLIQEEEYDAAGNLLYSTEG